MRVVIIFPLVRISSPHECNGEGGVGAPELFGFNCHFVISRNLEDNVSCCMVKYKISLSLHNLTVAEKQGGKWLNTCYNLK